MYHRNQNSWLIGFNGCENFSDFAVGPFRVSPSAHSISRKTKHIRVEAKVMDVLCLMAIRSGEVVTRSQFIDYLWDGRPGSDECLTRAISLLRAAFRTLDDHSAMIQTIPKSGYCLIGKVKTQGEI